MIPRQYAQVLQNASFEHLLCRETPIQGVIGVKMEKKTQSSYLHLYPKRLPCKIFTTVLKMHVWYILRCTRYHVVMTWLHPSLADRDGPCLTYRHKPRLFAHRGWSLLSRRSPSKAANAWPSCIVFSHRVKELHVMKCKIVETEWCSYRGFFCWNLMVNSCFARNPQQSDPRSKFFLKDMGTQPFCLTNRYFCADRSSCPPSVSDRGVHDDILPARLMCEQGSSPSGFSFDR